VAPPLGFFESGENRTQLPKSKIKKGPGHAADRSLKSNGGLWTRGGPGGSETRTIAISSR